MICKIAILFLIALCLITIRCAPQRDYAVDFQRVESIPGTKQSLYSVFGKFDRLGRGKELCAWGNITYAEDFGNDYKASVVLAISTNGGSHFIPSPFKVPTKDFCEFVNTTWRDHISPSVREVSTLPEIPPEGLCPFPKGSYMVNCFKIVPGDNWPNHVPTGTIKVTIKHLKSNEFVGGADFYFDVYSLK